MNLLTTRRTLWLLLALSACGKQLVQFELPDAAGSGGGTDARTQTDAAGGGDGAGNDAATSAPRVISTGPVNGATNVSVDRQVTATFDRAMAPATLTSATFTVKQGTTTIVGAVSYTATTATFVATSAFDVAQQYTATITTGATDTHDAALAADYVWTFTIGACSQAPVVLGSSGNFAVLAGSTVTSTGATAITGNLGVSPGTAVTGFPPGTMTGAEHAGDPTAAQGVDDLTTAYDDARGRTLCATTVAGNLGGQTLTPGLYVSTSSLGITSGDLTLDAQGDPDAVFIFQMASTLTTTSGRQVILSGGANAANVFWQVGSSATLGTTSAFAGTILAQTAITLGTGATLDGRALAITAAVALDTNSVVTPAP